jgi:rhodanese-related sulfurtransferase
MRYVWRMERSNPAESLIPAIGSVPPDERMFRINWVANLQRSPSGVPVVSPHFVATQGRRVRLIDLRDMAELLGPLGYIPGVDWVPESEASSLDARLDRDEAVIFVSQGDERSSRVARALEAQGHRLVASMQGGVIAWKGLGYATVRDREILERRNALHRTVVHALPAGQTLSKQHVEEHIGDPRTVRWIKLAALFVHGRLSCVDGRDDAGVLGTPGGDAGELTLALSAVERLTGHTFSDDQVAALIRARIDALGRFYMHTDIHAANHAIAKMRADARFADALRNVSEALEWRSFWLSPPDAVRAPLLDLATDPPNVGCGHLRRALKLADEYGTRADLVGAVLRSFHRERWAGSTETELVVLAGDHREGGVLTVRIEGPVRPFSWIPLVSPSAFGTQMFVSHPQVASYLRLQLAEILAAERELVPEVDPAALHAEMERIAAVQLASTLGALAKGLPIYELTFDRRRCATVREAGVVG